MNASSAGRPRWSLDQANAWYRQQPWIVGTNFVPSTACNTTELWQADTFDLPTMNRELSWAAKLGFNSIRVFIQYIVWKDDPAGLLQRFEQVVALADQLGMSVMPVLFDDCVFGWPRQLEPFPGKQREPVPGMILPSWTPSPGRYLGVDRSERPSLRRYVQDFVDGFGRDHRIVMWDLFNEPLDATGVGTPDFLHMAFGWAREVSPTQPLTVCIYNNFEGNNRAIIGESDIISFHAYLPLDRLQARVAMLRAHGRPLVCTEWMARPLGGNYATDMPWLKQENIACYQWGLVNGRTQCQYTWLDLPASGPAPEPEDWFHDIFHADGRAYREEENEAIRRIIRGG